MNENENKNIQKDSPEENESATPEDTKAFNFEWTDDTSQDQGESGSDSEKPSEDEEGSDIGENSVSEESPVGEESPVSEQSDSDEAAEFRSSEAETAGPSGSAVESKPQKPSPLLKISCILSAGAMLLLAVFAIGILSGLFPSDIGDSIFSNVSSLGQTDPEVEASPELLEEVMKSVVIIQSRSSTGVSTGTGMIISSNGYIVTNHHVVEKNLKDVTVTLFGEETAVRAEVVGYKEVDDLAVLKIDRTGLKALTFADSDSVRYGEKVYAIGTPEGSEFGWSITQGIVSCPDRQIVIYNSNGEIEKKMNVVQTDASVNHGNSGGPLINVRGEVVGIITLKLSESAGMGFALPSDGVLIDVEAILKQGHANNVDSGIASPRPILGITGVGVLGKTWYENVEVDGKSSIKAVDAEYANNNPQSTFYASVTGVYISSTTKGYDSASKLKNGDIITEINGNTVAGIYEVMDIINRYDGGDKITVKYYREGKYYTSEVTLGSQKLP